MNAPLYASTLTRMPVRAAYLPHNRRTDAYRAAATAARACLSVQLTTYIQPYLPIKKKRNAWLRRHLPFCVAALLRAALKVQPLVQRHCQNHLPRFCQLPGNGPPATIGHV